MHGSIRSFMLGCCSRRLSLSLSLSVSSNFLTHSLGPSLLWVLQKEPEKKVKVPKVPLSVRFGEWFHHKPVDADDEDTYCGTRNSQKWRKLATFLLFLGFFFLLPQHDAVFGHRHESTVMPRLCFDCASALLHMRYISVSLCGCSVFNSPPQHSNTNSRWCKPFARFPAAGSILLFYTVFYGVLVCFWAICYAGEMPRVQ
jgi:hypothetical protein